MAYEKRKMTELEKQAKLTALKGAHSSATDMMKGDLHKLKDPADLKKHDANMSKIAGHDFMNDSDKIEDPQREGNVIGRHVSDKNDDIESSADLSVYDIDLEIERLNKLRSKGK